MRRPARSILPRYGVALLSIALATGLRLLLDPVLGDLFPFATLFFAVLVAAWYGGFGPALAATAAGGAAATLILLPPRGSFAVAGLENQAGLALYLGVGLGIALLGGAMRAARARAEGDAAGSARQREELRITLASIGDAVLVTDAAGRVAALNPAAAALTGWPAAEAVGRPLGEVFCLVHGLTRQPAESPVIRVVRQGSAVGLANETLVRARDGAERAIDASAAPIRDAAGHLTGVVLVCRDVTDRRRDEADRRAQADVLNGILAASVDHLYVVDRQGRYRQVSAGGARVLGRHPADLIGKHWRELGLPAAVMERFDAQRERVLASGVPAVEEAVFRDPQGVDRSFEYVVAPILGPGGQAEAVAVVSRDVTDRKQAEAALRQAEALLEAVIDHAPACIFAKDRQGRYLLANRALARLVGREQQEFKGRTDHDFFPAEVAAQFGRDDAAIMAANEPRTYEESFPQDGVTRTYLTIKFPLRDAGGEAYAACAVATEITDLKRAQEALRATADRLNLALAAAQLGDWSWDAATDVVTLSERAGAIFGLPPTPHLTWTRMLELLDGADRDRARRAVERAVAGHTHYDIEYRVNRPGGGQVWVAALGRAHYAAAGRPLGMYGVVQDVTARKEAEAALKASEERLRLALEAGRMGVWDWDLRADAVRGSDDPAPIHGLAPGAFAGTPEAFERFVHPADRERVRQAVARAVAERGRYEIEFRTTWPDGSVHWMAGKGRVFLGADARPARLIGVGLDVTARKRAEQDARFLADASAALAALVDDESTFQKVARLAVPHFADWATVDVRDEGGGLRRLAVAHVDPAKVELAHELHRRFPPDPAAPRGVWQILRTGQPELVAEITDDLLASSTQDPDLLRILRELGLRSYVGVPLSVRGKVLGVITFIAAESGRRYDAAALAVAEDLAHRAAVALENARLYEEVREADRRKDEFLAVLGHELRNPLAPISNALHLLKQPGANGAVTARAREMMERQVQHMVRLVDDLLDVSRIVRGKVELRKEPIDLAVVVARAAETAQPLIEAEGHRLAVHLPAEPLRVSGDLVRLAQVVGNLLNNAARYTERGGRIMIEGERAGGRAVLRVRDTGIGIAAAALPRIWEMFVQADRRVKGAQGGMGIGLALVKGLVELHGGTVNAHSDGPGRGSTFTVTLPLLAADGPAPAPAEDRAAPAAARRVLVVDDNEDAAESLALLLRLQGHAARVAHDGPTALQLAGAEPPEVAFLDLGMPGMDGYEVARRFRGDPALRGVRLVALTGWGQEEDRRRTREAGFDAHEVKPVSPEALDRLLRVAPG